ncbi:MAG: hypothetical protein JSV92_03310 [archaeon]|nr:MAG: hypothetical protein JSV92_03310 [archaeon]
MKKYIPLLIILIFLILVWVAINFFQVGEGEEKPEVKSEIFSDLETVYSQFTPFMEDHVDSKLEEINCEPSGYYYLDSEVCFVCEEVEACFGYGWVNRTGGKKMNPSGPSTIKTDEFDRKFVDFHMKGLATLFNCINVNETLLSCDHGILMEKNEPGSCISEVNITYSGEIDKDKIAGEICEHLGGEEISYVEEDSTYSCNFASGLPEKMYIGQGLIVI